MSLGIVAGFELDRRWHQLRGEMDDSKKPALLRLARVLEATGVDYAIIGGIAVQVHQEEPRTTLDIDVAVRARAQIPAAALLAAGFQRTGSYEHSENWVGAGATPVQFTDDPQLGDFFLRTIDVSVEDVTLRVLGAEDLLHAKLRAAGDPARRRSKRLQDLADAQALVEKRPELDATLSREERALLGWGPV